MIKIFKSEDDYSKKVNFVDDENKLVGFDFYDDCCSYGGWFISETMTHKFEDGKSTMPKEPESHPDLTPYSFDKDFYCVKNVNGEDVYAEGKVAIFRMTAPKEPDLYLHLFNMHNGYYSKGITSWRGDEDYV